MTCSTNDFNGFPIFNRRRSDRFSPGNPVVGQDARVIRFVGGRHRHVASCKVVRNRGTPVYQRYTRKLIERG